MTIQHHQSGNEGGNFQFPVEKLPELYRTIYTQLLRMWKSDSQGAIVEHLNVKRMDNNPRLVQLSTSLSWESVQGMTSTDEDIYTMLSPIVDVCITANAIFSAEKLLQYELSFRPNCPNRDGIIDKDLKFFFPELISVYDSNKQMGDQFAAKLTTSTVSLLTIPDEYHQVISEKLDTLKQDSEDPLPLQVRCEKVRGGHFRNKETDFSMFLLSYLAHTRKVI